MSAAGDGGAAPFDPRSITRPDPVLQTYYILVALLTLAGFPFVVVPLLFKYQTLRYEFDDDGVKMSWGILFRREIVLTYRRIQDIHVTRNIIQRWLGLASVAVQTASGASGAEMTIEGLRDPEALRDFLYDRMRGARGDGDEQAADERAPADEALALLRGIRDELRAMPRARGAAGSSPGGGAS